MARKTNLDALIHCDACGEDYSATYKRCPFCGERAPRASHPVRETARETTAPIPSLEDEEDDYVFDGQDAFDDEPAPVRPARAKGGKRLASKQSGSQRGGQSSRASDAPREPKSINWPKLISFLCSLVIVAAALVIVFTVLYPQLRQDPGSAASDPAGTVSQDVPASQEPGSQAPAGEDPLTAMSLDTDSLTLLAGGSHQLVLTLEPVEWVGEVVWTSSDDSVATVSPTGLVTNVNTGADTGRAQITVTAGGLTAQCDVYCTGSGTVASEPPVQSDPPAENTPGESGGDIPAGPATIVNADGGLRVRSGPGTSHEILASIFNDTDITVVRYAGDGWYEITFHGPGGADTTGYIMGEYISAS